ncbi:hypothetical protein HYC85_001374 [Camellia sinensis]|uniref:Vacuolar protein sorting-associated protein 26 n=1 Tax=Camellia sinensis TaxID=4442 RepID=A0A7J7I5U7_CAMSI|nr:hypothetical protein HYC85_001374 [Camellia sinensis]
MDLGSWILGLRLAGMDLAGYDADLLIFFVGNISSLLSVRVKQRVSSQWLPVNPIDGGRRLSLFLYLLLRAFSSTTTTIYTTTTTTVSITTTTMTTIISITSTISINTVSTTGVVNKAFELVFDREHHGKQLFFLQNYIIGAFKPACNISITFSDEKTRKKAPMKKENGQTMMIPLFQSQENIAGKISIEPVQGKRVEHNGIKIELLGQIEMYFDRGNFYDFTSLVRELDVPGELFERKTYPFEFSTVEMPYETYNGVNVRLRYVLKVTISRGYAGSIVEYQDFVVISLFAIAAHPLILTIVLRSVWYCNVFYIRTN